MPPIIIIIIIQGYCLSKSKDLNVGTKSCFLYSSRMNIRAEVKQPDVPEGKVDR